MPITDVRVVAMDVEPGRSWTFVELYTEDGQVDVGEMSQASHPRAVAAEVRTLAPAVVGADPTDLINRLREYREYLKAFNSHRVTYAAVSGLEQACWDLTGQQTGLPVYRLLGGSVHDHVPLYANVPLAADRGDPDQYAPLAARAVQEGFAAVKLNALSPDISMPRTSDAWSWSAALDLAVKRVESVRQAVGEATLVLTDWSFRLTEPHAQALVERMAPYHLFWVEEPLETPTAPALARLKGRMGCRLAGGEQLSTFAAFHTLLEAGAVDVLMPDPKWTGGISGLKRVADLASAYGVDVAPHNMSRPVATAACVNACATLGNFLLLEYCWGTAPWRAELVGDTEGIFQGRAHLPTRPGLGMVWDGRVARRYGYEL